MKAPRHTVLICEACGFRSVAVTARAVLEADALHQAYAHAEPDVDLQTAAAVPDTDSSPLRGSKKRMTT